MFLSDHPRQKQRLFPNFSSFAIPVSQQVSLSDEGPLLETWEFFVISDGSYQHLNFLRNLTLSTKYPIFKS